MTLYVDTSRIGLHGIGRYSREVVDRLDGDWLDLGQRLRRPLVIDAVNPKRMSLRPSDTVYGPGFNAGLTRATQLLTVHDLIHLRVKSEGSRLKTLYYERIVRPAIRRAGSVFTVSKTSADELDEWLADDSIDVINTGNGVSSAFKPLERPKRSDYFMYVGNMREHKNVGVILSAMALDEDFRLVMVTSDVEEAQAAVQAKGLEDRTTILTGVSDEELARYYQGALGLLMPSTLEGFGLPAAEAVSCGTAVVFWTGCRSVSEIVGESGIGVSSSTDPGAWRSAMSAVAGGAFQSDRHGEYKWDDVASVVNSTLRLHR